jgi:hypothetical protein
VIHSGSQAFEHFALNTEQGFQRNLLRGRGVEQREVSS